jgi:hypothetical protein
VAMVQRQARHDMLAEQGEALYRKVVRFSADGYIDPQEQTELKQDARRLFVNAQLQSTRLRLARRMISGGDMDREILGEVRDYMELQHETKACNGWNPLQALETI